MTRAQLIGYVSLAMSASNFTAKRKLTSGSVSPPPLKRKVQSGTTKNAVASFFTPASQKPKERTIWSERSPGDDAPGTLLVGRYEPENHDAKTGLRRKLAAFDLDSTLITTSSGKKHAKGAMDWKWWDSRVPDRLRQLYNDEGYQLAILSNQAGLTLHFDAKFKGPKASAQKRVAEFKQKCNAILTALDLPISVYAATERDIFRKPRMGMWNEFCKDHGIPQEEVDLKNSFFVGDAGGRIVALKGTSTGVAATAKDFSCSDRNLAHNIGIEYTTPEEYFLGEKPRDFVRDFDLAKHPYSLETAAEPGVLFTKKNDKDIVLFCGPPGAGKSTFYWTYLQPLGYRRINQDTLKTRDKCVQAAKDALKDGDSVVIDNTNPDVEVRAIWIDLAKTFKVPIRCVWFKTPLHIAEHNDAVRANNKLLNPESRQGLPKLAFTGFVSRFKAPQVKEGFQDITELDFRFRGSEDEYKIWGRYWV
ncbi:hypothetical protein S7711_02690 [Stachybotrys chartarum IBT 7711]|uniref:Bifunctional polynucleotide phosphatase/kinase n=1 Tax=Stachybotrys chartarum (strain CBS 109288 / IBT 7711) TaxID=1280523 RepID=A0A084AZ01_STACB|nr:hypothetical protein S7711_02690 [Stachybotrys chartarum IBT 7711]